MWNVLVAASQTSHQNSEMLKSSLSEEQRVFTQTRKIFTKVFVYTLVKFLKSQCEGVFSDKGDQPYKNEYVEK